MSRPSRTPPAFPIAEADAMLRCEALRCEAREAREVREVPVPGGLMVLSEILIEETRHVTVFPCTVYIIQILYIYIYYDLYIM